MTKLMKILYGKEEYHQELSKNQSKMKLKKTIKCFYFSEKKKKKKKKKFLLHKHFLSRKHLVNRHCNCVVPGN